MKKFFSIFAVLIIFCFLPSCYAKTYDDGYAEGYEYGYDEGYYVGYYDGAIDAQRMIASRVEDDLRSLGREIKDEYGMHPGNAVEVLSNYADVPDEVTEEELHQAIWAIYRYYYKTHDVIKGIEDYQID